MHWGGGGYHEYIEGCSVHWDFQQKLKGFHQLAAPNVKMISPNVLNIPDVIMVSPQCT